MRVYVLAALTALLVTVLLTPLVQKWAVRRGYVDYPGGRRVHTRPTPRAGGLAIYAGFWVAMLLWSHRGPQQLWPLWLASTLIVGLGLLDDARNLRPAIKFAGQLVAATFLVLMGTRIDFVTNPLGGMIYLGYWAIPVTIFWLVAVTNTLNFIDGLDGLAAGVASIACIPLFLVALQLDRTSAAFMTIALAGAAVGFLRYNFNPARIFMGDTGAMFLGFMLAAIAVEGALKGAAALSLAIPILALGVPVLDTTLAIIRRWASGRPVYEADKGHLHHRLLALGLTQRQAVMVLYAASGVLAGAALWVTHLNPAEGMALMATLAVVAVILAQRLGSLGARGRGRSSRAL